MLGKSKDIINKAMDAGADEAEVFAATSKSTSVEVLDKKIEAIDIKEETGLGLRIFKKGRLGFSYTTEFSDDQIDSLIKQAISNSNDSEEDPFNKLPKKHKIKSMPAGKAGTKSKIYDEKIARVPADKKIELALKIERAARAFDPRVTKTEKSVYFDSESEILVLNSNGVSSSSKQNLCGGFIEIIAEEDGRMENGAYSKYVKAFDKFDPEEIGEHAARRAIELLGAKTISSEKLDLVMDPTVAESFLEALFPLFSSDFVQKNKSALKGKVGSAIGSRVLTIIDDGGLKGGVASLPFDTEGTPTQETVLVEDGTLMGFLYNNYTALKDKTNSTGNGERGSFKGVPVVSPTNLYIKPGPDRPEEIVKGINKGLYVTRVMGMHTINPVSGDFSVGAAGIMIENGTKTFAVRGVTISGNLIELLKNVKAVCNDFEITGSVISPTLLIEGITVSGN